MGMKIRQYHRSDTVSHKFAITTFVGLYSYWLPVYVYVRQKVHPKNWLNYKDNIWILAIIWLHFQNNVSEIRAFYIRLFGFKNESKNQIIPINQSTVERQKYCLEPQRYRKHFRENFSEDKHKTLQFRCFNCFKVKRFYELVVQYW